MIELSTMVFENIPFPVSTNQLFAGKSRRYKSKKYKAWETEFDLWSIPKMGFIRETGRVVREYLTDPKNFLTFAVELNVPGSMIFTKDGRNKRIDATNYLKCLIDALSSELEIDDNRIFLSKVEFVVYNIKDFTPNVTVFIEQTRIREKRCGTKKENDSQKAKN